MGQVRIILFAMVLVFLTGCGVRGPLEPPPNAPPKKNDPFILDKAIGS
ncbi:MAG: lipoprotein [Hyphomicrobiales bacterium]